VSVANTGTALFFAIIALGVTATAVLADDAQFKRGEDLLTRNCARCHAVGTAGASPSTNAPAFRTLGKRYPIGSLEEALGEGTISSHPDMPDFEFDADDVSAIIAYLKSIQSP
jgi:mono/diheme cytochrome c family protein